MLARRFRSIKSFYRLFFCLVLSFGVSILGCGSSFVDPFSSGSSDSGTPGNGSVSFSGKVLLRSLSLLPENVASEFSANRTTFESEGYFLSSDARVLGHPTSPAVSWIVEFGNQRVLVEPDGSFTLQPPNDGATEGVIRHPSDSKFFYGFTLKDLGQAKAAGSSIILPIFLGDPCGMRGDGDVFCSSPAARPRVVLAKPTEPDGFRPLLKPWNFPRSIDFEHKKTKRKLGTYPGGSSVECFIQDGILDISDSIPFSDKLNYLGSTCDIYVLAGACPNENTLSDAELAAVREFVERNPALVESLFGDNVPIINYSQPTRLHCDQNHKLRSCTQVVIGDVACELPDKRLVKANESAVVLVPVGGEATFTLHNNGVFGITQIAQEKTDAAGKLTDPVGKQGLFPLDAPTEIRHYLPIDQVFDYESNTKPKSYEADQDIVYTPGPNALPDQEDTYRFVVDDKAITLTFRIVGVPAFLRRLGAAEDLLVHDINSKGLMAVGRSTGLFLESALETTPVQLLAAPGEALLNDEGLCLYQAADHQSHAKIRFPDGRESDNLMPPNGSLSEFSEGIVALSPQGFYFCKAKRPDGKNDFFTQVVGNTVTVETDFLNAPAGLAPSTEVTLLTSTTENELFGNSPGGPAVGEFAGLSNAGKLAKFSISSRTWSSEIVPLRPDFLPGFGSGARYVDASSKNVLYTESGDNWFRTPPTGVTWAQFFNVLLQNGGRQTEHRKSEIRGPGARTVFTSEDPLFDANRDPIAAGISHRVIAMNEELEVVGTITDANVTRPVIFKDGSPIDLVPLFPNGAPAGTWEPLKMAGRYILLRHTDGDSNVSLYLFFRGDA